MRTPYLQTVGAFHYLYESGEPWVHKFFQKIFTVDTVLKHYQFQFGINFWHRTWKWKSFIISDLDHPRIIHFALSSKSSRSNINSRIFSDLLRSIHQVLVLTAGFPHCPPVQLVHRCPRVSWTVVVLVALPWRNIKKVKILKTVMPAGSDLGLTPKVRLIVANDYVLFIPFFNPS